MTVGVIIVSRSEADPLVRTVLALKGQLRRGDELLVAAGPWDSEVRAMLADLPVRVVDVYLTEPVHGQNAGVAACSADVAVFLAPDAEVPGDWLERIRRHFHERSTLGVLMGPVVGAAENGIEPGCGLALRRRLIERFEPKYARTYAAFTDHVVAGMRKRGCEVLCDPALPVVVHTEQKQPAKGSSRGPAVVSNIARLARGLTDRGGCCSSHPGARCSAQRRRYCAAGAGVALPDCLLDPGLTEI